MNAEQHKIFNIAIQSVSESRAGLHDSCRELLIILMLAAILAFAAVWLWILLGGFSRYLSPGSAITRKALEQWLREEP